MFHFRWGQAGVSAIALALALPSAKAQQYEATQISWPSPVGPWAINDSGSVTGNGAVFTTRTGSFEFPAPFGAGLGINSSDTVVGYGPGGDGFPHAIAHAFSHTNTVAYPHTLANEGAHAHPEAESDPCAESDSRNNTHPNPHAGSDPDLTADPDARGESNTFGNSHAVADEGAHAYAEADSDAKAESDPNAPFLK
jgi:hypothetical protein